MSLRILCVGGEETPTNRWADHIRDAGYELTGVLGAQDPIHSYEEQRPDAAVLVPSSDTVVLLECLHKIKIPFPELPVFALCDEEELLSTECCGPFSRVTCLPSKTSPSSLTEALIRAHEEALSASPDGLPYPIVVGKSPAILEIRRKIKSVADKDIAVLVTGESGTGKELIARSIHCHSLREKAPLVKISCGALPDELLESEVFGYQQGAFTGAHENKPGRLELAHEGSLFMDEIGDLPLPLQVKFLQVLEEKAFFRLGGIEDKIVDTRVIAATNADLLARVYDGSFRKDLYYRLSVVHIKASPLRERREDIPLLIHYFLNKYCFELKRPVLDVPEDVMRLLFAYYWPGNVREMENLVRRAVVMRSWDFLFEEINLEEDPGDEREAEENVKKGDLRKWGAERIKEHLSREGASLRSIVKEYTAEMEREAILEVLEIARWNRKEAARLLGVSYKTLLNRINDFELTR